MMNDRRAFSAEDAYLKISERVNVLEAEQRRQGDVQEKQGKELDSQSAILAKIDKNTSELVAITEASKGFWRVVGWGSTAIRKLFPYTVLAGLFTGYLKFQGIDLKDLLK